MSRKQEIYISMLRWAAPDARSALSVFSSSRPLRVVWGEKLRFLRASYEIAELVHNLPVTVLPIFRFYPSPKGYS